MKRNYFKFIAVFCGIICISVLSGCCSLLDYYSPAPSYYYYAPRPPHRHHYAPRHRHCHHHCLTEVPVSDNYDMAAL